MKSFLSILCFFPLLLFAQEEGVFRIEIESSLRTFSLNDFNETLNNKEYIGTDNYDIVAIKNGFAYGTNISYSFSNFLSFGIYGETQSGRLSQNIYYKFEDEFGNLNTTILVRDFQVQSFSLGIISNLILNNLNSWNNKLWLSNIESNISLQAGYGKAYFLTGSNWENAEESNLAKGISYSNGFQLVTSFKVGYILTEMNYFSSMGFKFGYQYFETSELRFREETYPESGKFTNLNFSGWLFGIYLNIGR